jgi:putative protease
MKNYNNRKIEILAPVGSYESLAAAIQARADSIYFGVSSLNMRSRSAQSFDFDDMKKIAEICRENNMKSYLTVNTVIYDSEMDKMKEVIDKAKEYGVSALIVSDQSAITYACQVGIPVHLSTQLNISNFETVKFYANFSDVMVLARELSLQKVYAIQQKIEQEQLKGPSGNLVRIEVFAHGALCMAISGKCYLSLHERNASANKGLCLQKCRKPYIVYDKDRGTELEVDNEYIMSPKDLCTINFVNKLLDAGVSVLKIEGRARSAEYVKTVCKSYSEAVESVIDGTYDDAKIQKWTEDLSTVFNRGFWDGYYLGKKLGEWSHRYGSQATERKEYVAKAIRYFSKLSVGEFYIETGEINVGDKIVISGPTTGVLEITVDELRVDLEKVEKAVKGDKVSLKVPAKVRPSDRMYKMVKTEFTKKIF